MKKIYFLITILLMVLVYACHKEVSGPDGPVNDAGAPVSFSIRDAKNYLKMSANLRANSVAMQSVDPDIVSRKGVILWKKAQIYRKSNNEVIEIPIVLNKRKIILYNIPADSLKELSDRSVIEASFSRLVLYRDVNKKVIDKKIVTYIPDKSSVRLLNHDASNNWINKLQSGFSGYLEYQNWDGSVYFLIRVKAGKQVAKYTVSISKGSAVKAITGLPNSSKKTANEVCITVSTPYGEYNCLTDSEGNLVDCIDIIEGYNDVTTCFDDGNGGGDNDPPQPTDPPPGGGDPTGPPPDGCPVTESVVNGMKILSDCSSSKIMSLTLITALPVIDPNPPIQPLKYFDCFTDGKTASGYKLTIYVDQPNPGHNDQFTLGSSSGVSYSQGGNIINVGHTFVGFEKDNTDGSSVKQVMGFYPGSASISAPGVIKDNSGHHYSESYTINVTATQFNSAITAVMYDYATANYTLANGLSSYEYNCTDAAKAWMSVAGIGLPAGGRGLFTNDPGDFGQAMRSVSGVNNVAGNAPTGHGPCL